VPSVKWSPADDARLRLRWGDRPVEDIALELGRTVHAVRLRAGLLDLPFGVARGYETFAAAAARAGYCHRSFRRAVRWWQDRGHRVDVSSLPAVRGTRAKGQWRQIDPADTDAIAAAYAASELPGQAAARLGITRETLRRRAVAAGHRVGKGQQLRLLPEEWDRVSYPRKGPQK